MTPAIVVLTDFFAVSNRALSYAAGLAVPLQSHLVLLHVRHDGLLSPEEYSNRDARRDEQQTEKALHQLASSLPVPTEVQISEAFLPEAVADSVRDHQPQLLVLGRPGTASTPVEIVTGAAMDLLRNVPFPLLIVPTVGWGDFPPRRLVLAVDGDPFKLYENQGIVAQLLKALNATLTILYVTNEKDPGAAAGHRVQHTIMDSGFEALTADKYPHIVYHSHAAQGIMQGATELEADLLVVVARRHSLLGSLFHRSVTAQLIGESALPVLLLPAQD
ncbi:universal stress protein [Hymenobacter sp. BT683]|uniref:Universal stress protein n=1 Tax=Hymenobacter jeongseonensis TaxID=2791027 RepID=A0ABS0IHD4_9BACT|nr:universal stress protein [Hymenobacter jeongseonensis]MBF9237759.1 universal stress protein [Hymenobacter jeongseonensis]